jgi:hypothetical protein
MICCLLTSCTVYKVDKSFCKLKPTAVNVLTRTPTNTGTFFINLYCEGNYDGN